MDSSLGVGGAVDDLADSRAVEGDARCPAPRVGLAGLALIGLPKMHSVSIGFVSRGLFSVPPVIHEAGQHQAEGDRAECKKLPRLAI